MKTGLYQTISPKLVLTPRLQQAINLLQMSNLELLFHIRQEMIQNPFLEEVTAEENIEEEKKLQNDETLKENENEEDDENSKIEEWQELLDGNSAIYGEQERKDFFEKPIENKTSLIQHLMWQMQMSKLTPDEHLLGEIIISEIDGKGYLRISLEELAKASDTSIKDLERVLKVIQTFEPVGVGARDLKECLLLQLEEKSENEKIAKILLENYLEEIENRDFNKIAVQLNKSLNEVETAADLISSLNPYPGSVLEEINNFYIIPDVIVDKVENEYVVTVNDERMPKLGLNKYYLKLMRSKEKKSDVSEFLSKKFQSANWLLSCIEQRRMTLYQITKAVIKKQYEFFEKGLEYLCPLNLKQIAGIVDLHESTVSRTVNNKYVQTPRGIFELKFFFLKGFSTVDNGSIPALMVKESVREIIQNEVTPLSDEEIAVILNQRGINIARRTVSKYRDELKIPTLNKRKSKSRSDHFIERRH